MSAMKLLLPFMLFLFIAAKSEAAVSNVFIARDTIPASDSNIQIFETVEREAEFSGGEQGWRTYLQQNLNANTPVDRGAPTGQYTVWVQFIVDKEGKVSDIKALTRNGFGMETEVLRIIRKSPLWTPALIGDQPVKAYRKQPVTFVVQEEKKKRRNKD